MKQMFKKALLPAAMLSLMFVVPAAALDPAGDTAQTAPAAPAVSALPAAPSEMSFQIPMHDYCSSDNPFDFGFQLSNAAETPANVTVYFYDKDGATLKDAGIAYSGMESTFVPAQPITMKGHATELYHINFGNNKKCDARIYSGKIVVNSGQASLLAKGWVSRRIGIETKQFENITINDNKSFELIKQP
ncbi:hypothetical protein [Paenibacillus thalictri]|uniref:Cohesin domain-containing protein n=1 Tax=Paenibacillus thalictri TaxID=2527873 RepID=A0A4Q9DY78_9BACL|nr:hypothetical protein [Paenibacillus thalictri]TBL80798.1 hypothetical protein EYB31_06130 [Paenibacillus thalictri]